MTKSKDRYFNVFTWPLMTESVPGDLMLSVTLNSIERCKKSPCFRAGEGRMGSVSKLTRVTTRTRRASFPARVSPLSHHGTPVIRQCRDMVVGGEPGGGRLGAGERGRPSKNLISPSTSG